MATSEEDVVIVRETISVLSQVTEDIDGGGDVGRRRLEGKPIAVDGGGEASAAGRPSLWLQLGGHLGRVPLRAWPHGRGAAQSVASPSQVMTCRVEQGSG